MSFQLKNNSSVVSICDKDYIYKTTKQTQEARIKMMEVISKLQGKAITPEEHIIVINATITAMCDYIEDTFGKGTIDSIFGENGSKNADYENLLDLCLYIISETAEIESKKFSKYAVVPDSQRK